MDAMDRFGEALVEAAGRRAASSRAQAPARLARQRVALAVLAACALGAALLLGARAGGGGAVAQAIAFRTEPGGEIIATVTEPFAAQSTLDAAFARRGLRIKVTLLPASPGAVGTVVFVGESGRGGPQIEPLQGGRCLSGGGGCAIGVRIPGDFKGEAQIVLGRPARAGEPYDTSQSAFSPGEPLHCSGLLGARASVAAAALARTGLAVSWREDSTTAGGSSTSRTVPAPAPGSYVWDAGLTSAGHLSVTVQSSPWPDTPGSGSQYDDGCRAR